MQKNGKNFIMRLFFGEQTLKMRIGGIKSAENPQADNGAFFGRKTLPQGVEPWLKVPEAVVLSIERWEQIYFGLVWLYEKKKTSRN